MVTSRTYGQRERGGALAELVLSIPLLMSLVGGMIFLGQKISLYGSASQTTFNAALYAAGLNSTAVSSSDVKELGATLLASGVNRNFFANGVNAEDFDLSYLDSNGDSEPDMVTVSFSGNIQGLEFGGYGKGSLRVSTSLPILGQDLASTINPNFENDSVLYCADGTVAPNNNPAQCPPITDEDIGVGCEKLPDICKVLLTQREVEESADQGGNDILGKL